MRAKFESNNQVNLLQQIERWWHKNGRPRLSSIKFKDGKKTYKFEATLETALVFASVSSGRTSSKGPSLQSIKRSKKVLSKLKGFAMDLETGGLKPGTFTAVVSDVDEEGNLTFMKL